jgi:hypothetical protein
MRKQAVEEDELDLFEINVLRAGEHKELIDDNTLICECMCFSAGDIRKKFDNSKIVDLEILVNDRCVGHGCSSCVKSFAQWKDKIF